MFILSESERADFSDPSLRDERIIIWLGWYF
ncbi:MAG: hypothetical protein ACI9MB_002114 [Verrucomicrobiales bacterium]